MFVIDNQSKVPIYEQIKTPYKYGAVMKLAGQKSDSPVVFKRDGKYYMSFISIFMIK